MLMCVRGSEEAIVGVLWGAVRHHIMGPVRTQGRNDLKWLRRKGESFKEWKALPAEDILLRWVSYHLKLEEVLPGFGSEEVRS